MTPAPRPAPRVTSILETCLYVEDVARAAEFYEALFGFTRMASDDRFCAFDIAVGSVLLIFQIGGTLRPVTIAGGLIPPHDGIAGGHFAFAIAAEDLTLWDERLAALG